MISQTERKRFRAIGHHLKPIVTVASKGVTDSVIQEIDRALRDHELIKIKVSAERDERKVVIQTLLETTKAELVQQIGATALLYRPAEEPDPGLSNLLRSLQDARR
ncbi:MAG: ribosome assembly RNA-binding protein YhbY [Pseudomonadales bacterium]